MVIAEELLHQSICMGFREPFWVGSVAPKLWEPRHCRSNSDILSRAFRSHQSKTFYTSKLFLKSQVSLNTLKAHHGEDLYPRSMATNRTVVAKERSLVKFCCCWRSASLPDSHYSKADHPHFSRSLFFISNFILDFQCNAEYHHSRMKMSRGDMA